MLSHITRHLELEKDDVFVDIGGGTGVFTKLVSTHAELESTPFCIDPSKEMCAKAEASGGIHVICEDANKFVSRNMDYDKVLIKEAIHHIKDRRHLWNGLFSHLRFGGRVLVVTRPQITPMPLFKAAKDAFFKNQPPCEFLVDELKSEGFLVKSNIDTYSLVLDKKIWYSMIKSRFMSDLAGFSDDEIKHGILEIDSIFPGGTIKIDDSIVFVFASKG